MNKELEALERLKTAPSFMGGTAEYQVCTQSEAVLMQDYEIVKQAVLELKSIKEANPSEALECLERMNENARVYISLEEYEKDSETIKQALLKAQKLAKENELLKEIIKSLFDRGSPLHQYTDKEGVLTIEVDDECSIMRLGEFKGVDLDAKLKEVLE